MKQYCVGEQKLSVRIKSNECSCFKEDKEEYLLDDLVPRGLCPHLYHIVLPYFFTLLSGGVFRWMLNSNEVEVQCPNPVDTIVLRITKVDKSIRLNVIDTSGQCPLGHHLNQSMTLDPDRLVFCPRAFFNMFPLLNRMQFDKNPAGPQTVTCPSSEKFTVFEIVPEAVK